MVSTTIDFDLLLYNQIAIVKGSTTMLFIKGGSGSTYYGYNNKYLDIARTINQKYGLTVAVSSNKLFSKIDLKAELQSVFTALNTHHQVLFAGVSSGAVVAIEQSPDIYDLQKLLLYGDKEQVNFFLNYFCRHIISDCSLLTPLL